MYLRAANDLPYGWVRAPIRSLCTLHNGRAFRPEDWRTEGLPIVRIQNLNNRRAPFNRFSGEVADKHRIVDGDLLFAWSGTPGTSFGAHVWRGAEAVLNQHIFRVDFDPSTVDRDYFCHALNQSLSTFIAQAHGGAGLAHITKRRLEETTIPLAPRSEQTRIATAISEAFDEIEAGEAALVRLRKEFTRFRASLLHAACTGALTADWRAARPALAGQCHDDALPPGWQKVKVAEAGRVQLGRQRAPQHHSGPHMRPYLRVANVFEDRIDTSDVMRMNFAPDEFAAYRLEVGDILLNEGQSAELVGRPAMFRGELADCCFTNTLVRYRAGPLLNRDFALLVFRWWLRTGAFQRIAKITTNIAHLGAGRFGDLLMPVPSLDEQGEIVRRAGELLTEVADVAIPKRQGADQLRRSVLHTALTGRLVPHDPADEPAATLLARLRAVPVKIRRTRGHIAAAQPGRTETPT